MTRARVVTYNNPKYSLEQSLRLRVSEGKKMNEVSPKVAIFLGASVVREGRKEGRKEGGISNSEYGVESWKSTGDSVFRHLQA